MQFFGMVFKLLKSLTMSHENTPHNFNHSTVSPAFGGDLDIRFGYVISAEK
jgi:hypothetical protein